MRIKSLIIENIQSIKHLKIDLDDNITRISGRNASGKSAVVKSLALFTGNYTRTEIKGLVRDNKLPNSVSRVSLLLEDGSILTAVIENNSSISYILVKDNKMVKTWNGYSDEIINLLNWRNVEDENFNLNIKESNIHLFINTKPRTNGTLVDYLCKDIEVETKIAKLEEKAEYIKKLSDEIREYQIHIESEYRAYPNVDKVSLDKLVNRIKGIHYTLLSLQAIETSLRHKNNMQELAKNKEFLQNLEILKKINLIDKYIKTVNKIKRLKYIKNYTIQILAINKNMKLKLKENNLFRLRQVFKLNRKLNKLNNINKCVNNIKTLDIKEVYIEKAKEINNNFKKIININKINKFVGHLNDKKKLDVQNLYKLTNKVNLYKTTNKIIYINDINKRVLKLKDLNYIINKEKIVNNANNISDKYIKVKKIRNYVPLFQDYKKFIDLNNNINVIKRRNDAIEVLKQKVDEIGICPLCGNTIKGNEICKKGGI